MGEGHTRGEAVIQPAEPKEGREQRPWGTEGKGHSTLNGVPMIPSWAVNMAPLVERTHEAHLQHHRNLV